VTSRREYLHGKKLRVSELQAGDCLKQLDGPFGTAIVSQATDKEVKLFRPYGTTAGVHLQRQPNHLLHRDRGEPSSLGTASKNLKCTIGRSKRDKHRAQ
jgi:hypothetical protein